MENDPHNEIEVLAERLLQAGLRVATAESCTGGWIAKQMTDLAGSSDWFECGFVTYSNRAKQRMLGVSEATLVSEGAVSEAVVREMVAGALQRSGADLAVSVSGIAGPGGGSLQKPVGTVWFAWQRNGETVHTACHQLAGDRESVRRQSVRVAVEGLHRALDSPTNRPPGA